MGRTFVKLRIISVLPWLHIPWYAISYKSKTDIMETSFSTKKDILFTLTLDFYSPMHQVDKQIETVKNKILNDVECLQYKRERLSF